MKSNEQPELTRKIETDSQKESRLRAGDRWVRGWRSGAKKKKDSWAQTTVWGLLGGGKGWVHGNG